MAVLFVNPTITVNDHTAVTTLTTVTIKNTSGSTSPTNTFFSFGQEFKAGDVPSGSIALLTNNDDSAIVHQWDAQRTWPDGSLSFAVCSGVTTALTAGSTRTFKIKSQVGSYNNTASRTTADINATAGRDIKLALTSFAGATNSTHDGSGAWTAALNTGLGESEVTVRRSGPACVQWRVMTPFRDNTGGGAHPHMKAVFYVKAWTNADGSVGPIQHICKPYQGDLNAGTAPQDTYSYDAAYKDGSTTIQSYTGVDHYYSSAWFTAQTTGQMQWSANSTTLSAIHVTKDTTYARSTKLHAPYDLSIAVTPSTVTPSTYSVRGVGAWDLPINGTGAHTHLGADPEWAANHFVSQDPTYAQHHLVNVLLAAVLPNHWIDEATNRIPTVMNTDYFGSGTKKPTVYFANSDAFSGVTVPNGNSADETFPWNYDATGHDCSHEPNHGYQAYLHWGEDHILELMYTHVAGMLMMWRPIYRTLTIGATTYYGVHIYTDGNPRLAGWWMNVLSCVAAVAPDADTEKTYFLDVLESNLAYASAKLASMSTAFQDGGWWYFTPSPYVLERAYMMAYIVVGALRTYTLHSSRFTDAVTWGNHLNKYWTGLLTEPTLAPSVAMRSYNLCASTSASVPTYPASFAEMSFNISDYKATWGASNTLTMTDPFSIGYVPKNGDRFRPTTMDEDFGTSFTLPSAITNLQNYYIINVSGQTFQISATNGGSAVTFDHTQASPSTQQAFWHLSTDTIDDTNAGGYPVEVAGIVGWSKALGLANATAARAAALTVVDPATLLVANHKWAFGEAF